jgi:SSS family solute:Na+ symporter
LLPRPLAPKRGLLLARLATLITGSISIVFAIRIKSLIDILIYAYQFWSPIILVPLAATLLGIRAGTGAFCAGAAAGLCGVFVWNRLLGTPGGFDGLLVGVFANLVVFWLTARLTRQPLIAPEGVA